MFQRKFHLIHLAANNTLRNAREANRLQCNAISRRSDLAPFLLVQICLPVSAVNQTCESAYWSPYRSNTTRSTAFGSLEVSVTGAFRITLDFPSALRSVTLLADIRLMVYLPGCNVVLPAENSKGMLTSTLLGACAWTLATANAKKMPKRATKL